MAGEYGPPQLDVGAAAAMLEQPGVRLLDVREDVEWAAGHAPSAEHCPLAKVEPAPYRDATAVVVVCRSGRRSQRAAVALHDAGVTAYNLTGGMQAWAQAGRRVVCDDGTPGLVA